MHIESISLDNADKLLLIAESKKYLLSAEIIEKLKKIRRKIHIDLNIIDRDKNSSYMYIENNKELMVVYMFNENIKEELFNEFVNKKLDFALLLFDEDDKYSDFFKFISSIKNYVRIIDFIDSYSDGYNVNIYFDKYIPVVLSSNNLEKFRFYRTARGFYFIKEHLSEYEELEEIFKSFKYTYIVIDKIITIYDRNNFIMSINILSEDFYEVKCLLYNDMLDPSEVENYVRFENV